jgi:methylisocitrate lyase
MKPSASPTALHEAIAGVTIQAPGAPNALAARLIEEAGYDACYLSGAAFSAGALALPDVGLFTLTELAQQTAYLTRRIDIPLIVDADTGFGDTVVVERTIVELEAAGAAAIQLEDQELPKRCGHLSGKTLVSPQAMCAKLRAASRSKSNPDLIILARTDAAAVEGIDAAIDRAKQYVDAGADWVFPEALTSADQFAAFAQAIDAPLVANMTEFGKSPLLSFAELADMGYAVVLYPVTLLRIAAKAMSDALATLRRDGEQSALIDSMQTREELYELLEYDAFAERDQEYLE